MGGVALDDLPGHFIDHAAMGVTSHIGSTTNPHSVTLDQAILAGDTATTAPIFNEGVTFGATVGNQTHVALKGKNTAGAQRRGGSIEWYGQNDVIAGYVFCNGNDRIVFDTTPQATRIDSGNAWIELDTGNASFASLIATSLVFNDNETLSFGTGTDMVVQHDAVDNLFTSNIRTFAGDEVGPDDMGFQFVHDVSTTTTINENVGSGRFGPLYNEASAVMEWAVKDDTSTYPFAWISGGGGAPHRLFGKYPPAFLLLRDNDLSRPFDAGMAIGCVNTSNSNFSGMFMDNTDTELLFYTDNVATIATTDRGVSFGSSISRIEIRSIAADQQLRMTIQAQDSGSFPYYEWENRIDIDTPANGSRFALFIHKKSTGDKELFTIWPDGASGGALKGIGVHADGGVFFDDSSNTQGDTYITYDSTNTTLDVFVDGSECMSLDTGVIKSVNFDVTNKTTNYTAADDRVITCDSSGGAFTVTLPAAAGSNRSYYIVKTDTSANAVTIDGNSSETINGSTTIALSTQYETVTIVSNGTAWFIL